MPKSQSNFQVFVRLRPGQTGASHCQYGQRTSTDLHSRTSGGSGGDPFAEPEHINDPRFEALLLHTKPVLSVQGKKVIVEPAEHLRAAQNDLRAQQGATTSKPSTPRDRRFERVASAPTAAARGDGGGRARAARPATPTPTPTAAASTASGVGAREAQRVFTYDGCFSSDVGHENYANQRQLFESVGRPVVDTIVEDGLNATVLAYGQTGSGKSYTMLGPNWSDYSEGLSKEELRAHGARRKCDLVNIIGRTSDRGLILRVCEDLFARLADKMVADRSVRYEVQVEYMQLYNDKAMSLLGPDAKTQLKVHVTDGRGVWVEGLVPQSLAVTRHDPQNDPNCTYNQFLCLLRMGTENREVAWTIHNVQSSRSHAIMNVYVTRKQADSGTGRVKERRTRLTLVDLAGSERLGRSNIKADRLHEASKINNSLSTLGRVIVALTNGKGAVVPYRDSPLTLLLKDSFGGNSRTVMIATISPLLKDLEETLSTLNYSSKAKSIENKPKANVDAAHAELVRQLREELRRKDDELESLRRAGTAAPPQLVAAREELALYERHRASTAWSEAAARQTQQLVDDYRHTLEEAQARCRELETQLEAATQRAEAAEAAARQATAETPAPPALPLPPAAASSAESAVMNELLVALRDLHRRLPPSSTSQPSSLSYSVGAGPQEPHVVADDEPTPTTQPTTPKGPQQQQQQPQARGAKLADKPTSVRFRGEMQVIAALGTDATEERYPSSALGGATTPRVTDASRVSLLRGVGQTPGRRIVVGTSHSNFTDDDEEESCEEEDDADLELESLEADAELAQNYEQLDPEARRRLLQRYGVATGEVDSLAPPFADGGGADAASAAAAAGDDDVPFAAQARAVLPDAPASAAKGTFELVSDSTHSDEEDEEQERDATGLGKVGSDSDESGNDNCAANSTIADSDAAAAAASARVRRIEQRASWRRSGVHDDSVSSAAVTPPRSPQQSRPRRGEAAAPMSHVGGGGGSSVSDSSSAAQLFENRLPAAAAVQREASAPDPYAGLTYVQLPPSPPRNGGCGGGKSSNHGVALSPLAAEADGKPTSAVLRRARETLEDARRTRLMAETRGPPPPPPAAAGAASGIAAAAGNAGVPEEPTLHERFSARQENRRSSSSTTTAAPRTSANARSYHHRRRRSESSDLDLTVRGPGGPGGSYSAAGAPGAAAGASAAAFPRSRAATGLTASPERFRRSASSTGSRGSSMHAQATLSSALRARAATPPTATSDPKQQRCDSATRARIMRRADPNAALSPAFVINSRYLCEISSNRSRAAGDGGASQRPSPSGRASPARGATQTSGPLWERASAQVRPGCNFLSQQPPPPPLSAADHAERIRQRLDDACRAVVDAGARPHRVAARVSSPPSIFR